ncbi:MAG: polysaccharide biosynthesis C-terminal domain-containing protein [Flavonifractor plautii]
MVILFVTRSYSVALSAYVARRRGKHPDESLTSCSRASLYAGVRSLDAAPGRDLDWSWPFLRLAGAQDDYINLGLQYAFPTLVSLALSGPAIVLHGILAGLGDTKSVLVSNVLGNGVNVVFNALLIYGLGPFPQLGVFGAGLGTAIGAGATLVYTLALFLRRRHPATLRGRGAWLPEREYLCSLAPLATGTFLEQAATVWDVHIFTPGSRPGHSGAKRPQHLWEPVRHLL